MKIRKLFALLMAAVMLLGMVPAHAQSDGDCVHMWDYSNGTWLSGRPVGCQDWKPIRYSCMYCSETFDSEASGLCVVNNWHWDGTPPSCGETGTQIGSCQYCGEPMERSARGEHSWGDWHGTKGTCLEPGREERSCHYCGTTEYRTGSTGAHDWGAWEKTKTGTCVEAGEETRACGLCGKKETRTTTMGAHQWGNWATTKPGTCVQEGAEHRSCSVCGKTETRSTGGGGHKYGDYTTVKEPTCVEKGRKEHYCEYCGAMEWGSIPMIDHSFGEWYVVTESQVGLAGLEQRDCIYGCGTNEQREIPALEQVVNGNDYVNGTVNPNWGNMTVTGLDVHKQLMNQPGNTTGAFAAGETISYMVTVTNNTGMDLLNVDIIDPLSGGDTVIGSYKKMPAGQGVTVTFHYIITAADAANGSVVNTAYATAETTQGISVRGTSNTVVTPVIAAEDNNNGSDDPAWGKQEDGNISVNGTITPGSFNPDGLTVTKSASAGDYSNPCKPGDEVTFTITVTNKTGVELLDVEITDPIKGGNEDAVLDRIASMQPSESVTASFSYTVTEEDATVGIEGFENTAYASGYTADGTKVSGTSETIFVWCVIPHEISISKIVSGTPANGEFYVPGETICFIISMSNDTPYPLYNVVLTDPLCEDQYFNDEVNGMSYLFMENFDSGDDPQGYSSARIAPTYVVTEADAEAGFVTNTAIVNYQTWNGENKTASASVTVKCGKAKNDGDMGLSGALYISKAVANTPANGKYFVPGEMIEFAICYYNSGDVPLVNVKVVDPLITDTTNAGGIHYLPVGVSAPEVTTVRYRVTDMDAAAGSIENMAYVNAFDEEGNQYVEYSNTVTVPCGFPEGNDPFGIFHSVAVVKTEESLPLNGQFYTEGEVIHYTITYTNDGELPLTDVEIWDILDVSTPIAHAETLQPGESRVCYYQHTVTAEDVAAGSVINIAHASYPVSNASGFVNSCSNMVVSKANAYDWMWGTPLFPMAPSPGTTTPDSTTPTPGGYTPGTGWTDLTPVAPGGSPTGGELPPFGTIDTDKLRSGSSYCERTITGRDNASVSYDTSFCAEHADTQASALLMQQAAVTPELQAQAASYAVALWQTEVKALYQKVYEAADPLAKAVVMTEYTRFLTEAANYEVLLKLLHPEQPALAAQMIAAMWEDKCVTLCNEAHAEASERKDSLLGVMPSTGAASTTCNCTVTAAASGKTNNKQSYCPVHGFPFSMIDMLLQGQNTAEAWAMVRQIWGVELTNAYNQISAKLGDNRILAMAEYNALTQWMMAREASLMALYPDNPEVVAQAMVKLIMDRVNDLCPTGK